MKFYRHDMMQKHVTSAEAASDFCEAIRTIASKPDNMENLEYYLAAHFDTWLQRFASSPADLAAELKEFANMEI